MNTGSADLQMSRFVNPLIWSIKGTGSCTPGPQGCYLVLLKVLTETNHAVGTLRDSCFPPILGFICSPSCTCPPVFTEVVKRIIEQMKLDDGLLGREDTKGRHGGVHTLWHLHFQRNQCTNLYTLFHFYGQIFTVGNVAEFLSIALHKTRLTKKQMIIWASQKYKERPSTWNEK